RHVRLCVVMFLLLFCHRILHCIHSFPTRRSSDLAWSVQTISHRFPTACPPPVTSGTLQFYSSSGCVHHGFCETFSKPLSMSNLLDRKSTRLNSSHVSISYAVFCFKTKNNTSQSVS